MSSPYELLDLPRTADDSQVRKAYFKAALKWHPDKNPDNVEVATEKFKLIAEAHEILSDPQKRAACDHQLDNPQRDYDIPQRGSSGSDGGYGGYGGYGFFGFGFGAPRTEMKTEEQKAWERQRQERAERAYARACKQEEIDAKKEAEAAERRRVRDAEKAAKQQAYKEQQARERQEQEELIRAAEEKKRQEEEEKTIIASEEKKRQQEKTRLAKQSRQRLRSSLSDKSAEIDGEDLQEFLLVTESSELDAISRQVEGCATGQEAAALVTGVVESWKGARRRAEQAEQQRLAHQKAEAAAAQRRAEAEAAQKTVDREWTTPELGLFAQACKLFPAGYTARWETIADFLVHNGYTRDKKECIDKATDLKSSPMQKGTGTESKAGKEPVAGAPCVDKPSADAMSSDDWTAEQQASLEAALVKHPASMPATERWASIAADVPGRTKKECVARFKLLRELAVSAKAAAEKAAAEKEELERRRQQKRQKEELAVGAKANAEKAASEKEDLERRRQQIRQKEGADALEHAKRDEEDRLEHERRKEEDRLQNIKEREEELEKDKREAADEREAKAVKQRILEAQRASRSRRVDANEVAENHQKQDDELVVFESVYSDSFVLEGDREFSLHFGWSKEGDCAVRVKLPSQYPSLCPPQASFRNLPLGFDSGKLCEQLEMFFVERVGEAILYEWIDELRRRFEDDGSFE